MRNYKSNKGNFITSLTNILILLAILVAVNFISEKVSFRADMTEENLFTLSEGSIDIVKSLPRKVKLKYYFTKNAEDVNLQYKMYGEKILELLNQYEKNSNGKLELEVIDPEPDSDEHTWAINYGIQTFPLRKGDIFCMGLTVICDGKDFTIPNFDISREELLEYDISELISRSQTKAKKTIGILSSLPVMDPTPVNPMEPRRQQPNEWFFVSELKKTYNVSSVAADSENIPEDIDILLAIHPKQLSEATLYAIDQYVLKGKKLFVMVDPACENDRSGGGFYGPSNNSELNRLFNKWGVTFNQSNVVADPSLATKIPLPRIGETDWPMLLSLTNGNFNPKTVVSSQLKNIQLLHCGTLSKSADSKYEFTPLITSTATGSTFNAMDFKTKQPMDIKNSIPEKGTELHLAALVKGKFASAFTTPPSTPPAKDETAQQKTAREQKDKAKAGKHIAECSTENNVFIIADVDFIADNLSFEPLNLGFIKAFQRRNDNSVLVSNIIDILGGSDALISIRSKGKFNRPFTKFDEIQKSASKVWQEEEKKLSEKLKVISARVSELTSRQKNPKAISSTVQAEISNARQEEINTRKKLREIRKNMRKDIEKLENTIKLLNFLFVPFILAVLGFIVIYRKNRKGGLS